jgi:hypothetical protein
MPAPLSPIEIKEEGPVCSGKEPGLVVGNCVGNTSRGEIVTLWKPCPNLPFIDSEREEIASGS